MRYAVYVLLHTAEEDFADKVMKVISECDIKVVWIKGEVYSKKHRGTVIGQNTKIRYEEHTLP